MLILWYNNTRWFAQAHSGFTQRLNTLPLWNAGVDKYDDLASVMNILWLHVRTRQLHNSFSVREVGECPVRKKAFVDAPNQTTVYMCGRGWHDQQFPNATTTLFFTCGNQNIHTYIPNLPVPHVYIQDLFGTVPTLLHLFYFSNFVYIVTGTLSYIRL